MNPRSLALSMLVIGQLFSLGCDDIPGGSIVQRPPTETRSIIVYAQGKGEEYIADIRSVVRYVSMLVVTDQFGYETRMFYHTPAGAESDLQEIVAGKSIYVGNCIKERKEPLSTEEVVTRDGHCKRTDKKIALYAECDEQNFTTLLSDDELHEPSHYKTVDITRNELFRPVTGATQCDDDPQFTPPAGLL